MKILQINKFYHIHGGTDRYFFEVSKLLKKHNHKVAFFSTEDKKNNKTKWSKFFVENFSFDKTNINNFFRLFPNYIFSLSAYVCIFGSDLVSGVSGEFFPLVCSTNVSCLWIYTH